MKKIVAFIMVLLMMFSSVEAGNFISFANKKDETSYVYDTSEFIKLDGEKHYKNITLTEEHAFEVYGCPNKVKDRFNIENKLKYSSKTKKYEWRYLGFTKDGEKATNTNYPDDFKNSSPFDKRNYIENDDNELTWQWGNNKKNKENKNDKNIKRKEKIENMRGLYESFKDLKNGKPVIVDRFYVYNLFKDSKKSYKKCANYSPKPNSSYGGQIVFNHKVKGHQYYDTVEFSKKNYHKINCELSAYYKKDLAPEVIKVKYSKDMKYLQLYLHANINIDIINNEYHGNSFGFDDVIDVDAVNGSNELLTYYEISGEGLCDEYNEKKNITSENMSVEDILVKLDISNMKVGQIKEFEYTLNVKAKDIYGSDGDDESKEEDKCKIKVQILESPAVELSLKKDDEDITDSIVVVGDLSFKKPFEIDVVDSSLDIGFEPTMKKWEVMRKDGSWYEFSSKNLKQVPYTIKGDEKLKDNTIHFRLTAYDNNYISHITKVKYVKFTTGLHPNLKINRFSKDVTNAIIKVKDIYFKKPYRLDVVDDSKNMGFKSVMKKWEVMKKDGSWHTFSNSNAKQVPYILKGTNYVKNNMITFRLWLLDSENKWHISKPRYVKFTTDTPQSQTANILDAELWANNEHDYLTVMLGQKIKLDGSRSICSEGNKITKYLYSGDGPLKIIRNSKKWGKAYYYDTGKYKLKLKISDNKGNTDISNIVEVKVVEPEYSGNIKAYGIFKENRKVNLELEFDKPTYLKASDVKWSATALDSQNAEDIYIKESLLNKTVAQFAKKGKYLINYSCKLEPMYNPSSLSYDFSTNKIIEIKEDIKPVVKYSITKKTYRNPRNYNKVELSVSNLSYSLDNDEVLGATLYVIYDKNDNGIIDKDEKPIPVLHNFKGIKNVILKEWVGNMFFYLKADEKPMQEYVFWKDEYTRSSNSREHMKLEDETVLVDNVSPLVLLDPSQQKKVQILSLTDKSKKDQIELDRKLEDLKVDLIEKGYEVQIDKRDDVVGVRQIEDIKRKYNIGLYLTVLADKQVIDSNGDKTKRKQVKVLIKDLVNDDIWDSEYENIKTLDYTDVKITEAGEGTFGSQGEGYSGKIKYYNVNIKGINYKVGLKTEKYHYDFYGNLKSSTILHNISSPNISKIINKYGEPVDKRNITINSINPSCVYSYSWDKSADKRYLLTTAQNRYSTSKYDKDLKKFLEKNKIDLVYSGDIKAARVKPFDIGILSDINKNDIVRTKEGLYYQINPDINNNIYYLKNYDDKMFYEDKYSKSLEQILNDEFNKNGGSGINNLVKVGYLGTTDKTEYQGWINDDSLKFYNKNNIKQYLLGDRLYLASMTINSGATSNKWDSPIIYVGKKEFKYIDDVKFVFKDRDIRYNLIEKSYINKENELILLNYFHGQEKGYWNLGYEDDEYNKKYLNKVYLDSVRKIKLNDLEYVDDWLGFKVLKDKNGKYNLYTVPAVNECKMISNPNGYYYWGKSDEQNKKEHIKNGIYTGELKLILSDITNQNDIWQKDGKIIFRKSEDTIELINKMDDYDYIKSEVSENFGEVVDIDVIYAISTKKDKIYMYKKDASMSNVTLNCHPSYHGAYMHKSYDIYDYKIDRGCLIIYFKAKVKEIYKKYGYEDLECVQSIQIYKDGYDTRFGYPNDSILTRIYKNNKNRRYNIVLDTILNKIIILSNNGYLNYSREDIKNKFKVDENDIALNEFVESPYARIFASDDDVMDYIKNENEVLVDDRTMYVLQDEEFNVDAYFEDYENDKFKGFFFKFNHKPLFDNNQGLHPDSGKNKITPTTKFHRVGIYDTTAKTKDDPQFDRYDYFSKSSPNYKIIVHRMPVAKLMINPIKNDDGTFTMKLTDNGSYDPDFVKTRSDKGIVEREYLYSATDVSGWKIYDQDGVILQNGFDYKFALRVKDVFGQWSEYDVREFKMRGGIPPIIDGVVSPKLIRNNEELNLVAYTNDVVQVTESIPNPVEVVLFKDTAREVKVDLSYVGIENDNKKWTGSIIIDNDVDEGEQIAYFTAKSIDGQIAKDTDDYNLLQNEPPSVWVKSYNPTYIYEGDDVDIVFGLDDPDKDKLNVQYYYSEDGNNYTSLCSKDAVSTPSDDTVNVKKVKLDKFYVKVIVKDPLGEMAQQVVKIDVNPLKVAGRVLHVDKWNENRILYNRAKTGFDNSPRDYNVFWSGEKLVLKANTTNIDNGSDVKCKKVHVKIVNEPYEMDLYSNDNINWNGVMWNKNMMDWKTGTKSFIFTSYYSNGTIKIDNVDIFINNDELYWKIHRAF